MDENEDLVSNLEMAKSKTSAAQELAKESVGLLRKTEEEKEVS